VKFPEGEGEHWAADWWAYVVGWCDLVHSAAGRRGERSRAERSREFGRGSRAEEEERSDLWAILVSGNAVFWVAALTRRGGGVLLAGGPALARERATCVRRDGLLRWALRLAG